MEYYSVIKKNEMLPIVATQRDLENITTCEGTQRQILYHLYMKYKKIIHMNLSTEQKQTHKYNFKKHLSLSKGKGSWGRWMGDWNGHMYTIDTMYNIVRAYCIQLREPYSVFSGDLSGKTKRGYMYICIL